MKTIKIELSENIKTLELHAISDLHIGDKNCDMQKVKAMIDVVANNENAVCILNGDLMNNSTRTSIGDTYSETLSPMKQIAEAVELIRPIKDKVCAIITGNHERRTYRKEGIDLAAIMAAELGLSDKFTPEGALLFIRFGEDGKRTLNGKPQKICYTVYATHGSGGGRKEGAKVIRLADLANIIDADVYIHSHTHLPVVFKQAFYRVNYQHYSAAKVTKLFVNTAATLDYGGYGQVAGYKPSATESPVIYLHSGTKNASAKL